MDEEKQIEGKEQAKTEINTGEGNQPRKNSIIDEANAIYKKLEEANKRFEQNLARQEEIMARQLLQGESSANTSEVSEDKKKKEDTINFWKGTGIDKAITRYG